MKKDMVAVALGVAVAAGVALDIKQMRDRKFNERDYSNMAGALLLGAGAAHIALGTIDMITE
ncbi:MAG: asparagine synthase [Clostridium sp.]|nr:asparagine synthase [Clostridium sp.]